MNLEQFIASPELKYAVITHESWLVDEVAQAISSSPRTFEHMSVLMVLLSISKSKVLELHEYVQGNVEYELTLGTGKVTLLLRSQVSELLKEQGDSNG